MPRNECLYILDFWELMCIMRGYERRHRHIWSSVRWATFHLMASQVGSDELRKSGINHPSDLIPFTWDKQTPSNAPSEEEIEEIHADMELFKKLRSKKEP